MKSNDQGEGDSPPESTWPNCPRFLPSISTRFIESKTMVTQIPSFECRFIHSKIYILPF